MVSYATLDDASTTDQPPNNRGSTGSSEEGKDDGDHRNPLTTVAMAAGRDSLVAPLSPVKPRNDEEMGLVKKDTEEDGAWPPSAFFILIVEFCERLSYYGATIVFYPYMKNMLGWDQSMQNAMYNVFNFWAYATTVIGGFVADTWTGKVRAVFGFCVCSVIGLSSLALSSAPFTWSNFPYDAEKGYAVPGFIIAIFFLGLGTGGIKSNVSTLMADQIGNCGPGVYSAVFRWFYWSINLGAFIGVLTTPVLHKELGEKKDIEDGGFFAPEIGAPKVKYETDGTGYWASFGMPLCAFFIGILVFTVGYIRKLYVDHPPKGSLLTEIYHASMYARKARKDAIACGKYVPRAHWLDWAEGSEYADVAHDFKLTLTASTVFFSYPVYWLCYNQMFSNLVEQAELMDRPSWLAPESLNVAGTLSLILLIPVFDKVIFPGLKKCGYEMSLLTRIPVGYVFGAVAISYCGFLEYMIHQDDAYKASPKDNRQSDVLCWYQLPAYVIFGVSEIFASVGGLEYAYTKAPQTMKSVVMSMFLLTNSFGSVLGMIISPVIKPENMVEVYLSLGGVLLLNAIIFALIYHPNLRRKLCICC